jgi:FixJ family two-component response regulator
MKEDKNLRWLKPQQIKILTLLCEDNTTKEIAEICKLSTRTVELHRDNLRIFFQVKTLPGLVCQAIKHGYYIIPEKNKG